MKQLIFSIFLFPFVLNGFSQCEPDTNCADIAEPGQICPDSLSSGQTGIAYNQVITIIPPDSAVIADQPVAIYKIEVDTITNLPPGLTYAGRTMELYPDSSYCFEISGTPPETGIFYLKITVIPYVFSIILNSEVALPAQTDSTSVFITIEEPSRVAGIRGNTFRLLPGTPNPYHTETLIGAYISGSGILRLVVFNITGKLVYDEQKQAVTGKNIFSFRGEKLSPGIYFFNVSFNHHKRTGKLVKIE